MDVIIETEQIIPELRREIVLVIEHKLPGTLRRNDWVAGFWDGTGELRDNAEKIGGQSHKYDCAIQLHIIGVFDSTALVGISFPNEKKDLWNTSARLDIKMFYEQTPDRFLISLLAMLVMGLMNRKFI